MKIREKTSLAVRERNFSRKHRSRLRLNQSKTKKGAQSETNFTKINLNNEEDGWQRIAGYRACNFIHIMRIQGNSSNDKTILMFGNYFFFIHFVTSFFVWLRFFLFMKFPHPHHVALEICSFRSFILDLCLSTLRFHFTAAELLRSPSFGKRRFPCQGKGRHKNRPQRQTKTWRVGALGENKFALGHSARDLSSSFGK